MIKKIILSFKNIDRRYILLGIGTGILGSEFGFPFGIAMMLILIAFLREK